MFKIDIYSGKIENRYSIKTDNQKHRGSKHNYCGIGKSPSIVSGKVYFSGLDGRLYCIDADNFSEIWITDLRNTD